MKKRAILLLTTMAVLVTGFSLALFLREPAQYSVSERRLLATAPTLNRAALESGKFMSQTEEYAMDQFPFRDTLRGLKAASELFLLQKKEINGLYLQNGHLSRLEYPMAPDRLEQSARLLRTLYDRHIAGTGSQVYLSVIPDKHFWLGPAGGYPTMEYAQLADTVRRGLPFADYVDIFPLLSADAYYRTDPHWRQEALGPVAKKLADAMGTDVGATLREVSLDTPFYGAYSGQLALPVQPDTLRYFTGPELEACTVTSYDRGTPEQREMYDLKKASERDPYEMFLCGSDALVTVENPDGDADKELILFRDSFGSSLAPLLVPGYGRITLVDLRYLRPEQVADHMDFHGQDILFLYSTLLLNQGLGISAKNF